MGRRKTSIKPYGAYTRIGVKAIDEWNPTAWIQIPFSLSISVDLGQFS